MKKDEILKEIVRLKKILETESLNQHQKLRLNWLIRNYLENPCHLLCSPKFIPEIKKLVNLEYDLIHAGPKNDKNQQELEKIKIKHETLNNQVQEEKEKLTEIYWSDPSALPLWAIAAPEELEAAKPRRMLSKAEGRTQELLQLFDDNGGWVFLDQYKTPYVFLPPGINVPMDSGEFDGWMRRIFGERHLSDEMVKTLKGILKGRAFSQDCKVIPLFTRVAEIWEYENFYGDERINFAVEALGWKTRVLYYDLGDGRAVRITSKGWSVVTPPILFRRFSHQKPQVEPKQFQPGHDIGEDVYKLLDFVNLPWTKIASGEGLLSDQQALNLVWFVAAFFPGFPHPILAVHGPQGSSKSTLLRVLKELLDPSAIQTLPLATTPDQFVLQSHSNWFLPLDNLSHISGEMSDALSRACTGDGMSKRKLYTDGDEFVLSFQRVIGLNGITLVTAAADLLDRSILVYLDRVQGEKRQTEKDFWKKFEKSRPYILGCVFDVLAEVLRTMEEMEWNEKQGQKNSHLPQDLSRMADFHIIGFIIATVLGCKNEFERGYRAALQQQNEEAIAGNPVPQVAVSFMKDKTFWKGPPADLLKEFNLQAEKLGIDTKSRYWPKDPTWLSRRVEKSKTNLEAVGIHLDRNKKGERLITLTKVPLKTSDEKDKDV